PRNREAVVQLQQSISLIGPSHCINRAAFAVFQNINPEILATLLQSLPISTELLLSRHRKLCVFIDQIQPGH
ncbi:MAG: hypothetical protein WCH35_12225, partial [Comamonadaceae bacterium]